MNEQDEIELDRLMNQHQYNAGAFREACIREGLPVDYCMREYRDVVGLANEAQGIHVDDRTAALLAWGLGAVLAVVLAMVLL